MYLEKNLRQLIADETARLIYEEGYRDYRLAKQKASQRFGADHQAKNQPSNEEIEQALHEYVQLIDPKEHQATLRLHREIALEAMEFLEPFQPFLTGAALEGTSSPVSAITLHLSANRAEDVMFYLEEKQLPFQIHDRKMKAGKKQDYFPLLRLYVDNVEVELMIFPDDGHGSLSALNSMTGKGIKRADYKRLQEILAAMPPP
ncbi:hypothetical protein SAMN02745130_03571 [Thiothrix eikelboomii]|uniref:Uncharacterized protein n=1 Tax=Thiothrix eikelboomii TaxID=92487 RepID=A0A1T4XWB5_9GAMM|nr:hypothetical protein [Thiothrix eikelboomii]SKA93800.1 hypothetical protein SAMN02745130_03571 [Thiothrix eikelboomii]